jgi:hypothetical protein
MAYCGPDEGSHTGVLISQKLDEITTSLNLEDLVLQLTMPFICKWYRENRQP